jgi:putative sporulation protein YtxC
VIAMKLLSVGLSETSDDIREKFYHNSAILNNSGFGVAVDETNRGNYTFLGFSINDGEVSFRNYERIKNLLKRYVAITLADLIMAKEEKNLIRKIINQNYHYFSDAERDLIYTSALKMLSNANDAYTDLSYDDRRNRVLNSIMNYFDTSYELVIDGFVNFRLKDYRHSLEQIVDHAVDDFLMDIEYKQFIQVLKYFVEIQEPRLPEVHVIISSSGVYKLLDNGGQTINNQYFDTFITNNADEINYEDLLISALITIAPQTIMIHNSNKVRDQSLVETIKNIFDGHVLVCTGCDLCHQG